MGQHDDYGKKVLRVATGDQFSEYSPGRTFLYCEGSSAYVDGVIGTQIAVEVESRVPKQIRGALMDLICHPFPKKLLLLLPVHMSNPVVTQKHCEAILRRFVPLNDFAVVLLNGSGDTPALTKDAEAVKQAVSFLTSGSSATAQAAG